MQRLGRGRVKWPPTAETIRSVSVLIVLLRVRGLRWPETNPGHGKATRTSYLLQNNRRV